ncbi:MAG: hypothetical protein M3Y41_12765 [Pseudomonadota bacterium]|nr:hypothetical protein [Pseudomonadota bacterium]
MINSDPPTAGLGGSQEDAVEDIVRSGARGAVVLAGITTAMVIALWFAFYWLVFVPRGTLP